MNLDLKGKKALVCGASQGLGFAIAEALADEGCKVGLLARNKEKLAAHVEAFCGRGLEAVALPADMGNWETVDSALQDFGAPSILVTNTGGPPSVSPTDVDPDLWRQQFEGMVLNQMRLITAVLPDMREERFGRIINIASTSVTEPLAALPISGSLRAALVNWLKLLAGEVARDGITVNTLLPGSIATERIVNLNRIIAEKHGIPPEVVAADAQAAIPAGRYGTPEEFAAVAAFLASPRASYVTGEMIRIDGGASKSL